MGVGAIGSGGCGGGAGAVTGGCGSAVATPVSTSPVEQSAEQQGMKDEFDRLQNAVPAAASSELHAAFDTQYAIQLTDSDDPKLIIGDIAKFIDAKQQRLQVIGNAIEADAAKNGGNRNPLAVQRWQMENEGTQQLAGTLQQLQGAQLTTEEARAARTAAEQSAMSPFAVLDAIKVVLGAEARQGKITTSARDAMHTTLDVVQAFQRKIGEIGIAIAADATTTGTFNQLALENMNEAATMLQELSVRGSRLRDVGSKITPEQAQRVNEAARAGIPELTKVLGEVYAEASGGQGAQVDQAAGQTQMVGGGGLPTDDSGAGSAFDLAMAGTA